MNLDREARLKEAESGKMMDSAIEIEVERRMMANDSGENKLQ